MSNFISERLSPSLIGLALGIAIVGGTLSFVSVFGPNAHYTTVTEDDFNQTRLQVAQLRNEMEQAKASISAFSKPQGESALTISVSRLAHDVDQLRQRMVELDKALLDTPTKSVSLLILRKDIDNLSVASKAVEERTKSDIDRIYDMNKWLLGSMAIAIVALALKVFFRPEPA